MEVRRHCNQMIHEYIEDPAAQADALEAGRVYVESLQSVISGIRQELEVRDLWVISGFTDWRPGSGRTSRERGWRVEEGTRLAGLARAGVHRAAAVGLTLCLTTWARTLGFQ